MCQETITHSSKSLHCVTLLLLIALLIDYDRKPKCSLLCFIHCDRISLLTHTHTHKHIHIQYTALSYSTGVHEWNLNIHTNQFYSDVFESNLESWKSRKIRREREKERKRVCPCDWEIEDTLRVVPFEDLFI